MGLGASLIDVNEVVSIYISRGEKINHHKDGMTPLHEAVLFGDRQLVEALLEFGADPNIAIDRDGSPVDKLNAKQFSEFLLKNNQEKFSEVYNFLQLYDSKPL